MIRQRRWVAPVVVAVIAAAAATAGGSQGSMPTAAPAVTPAAVAAGLPALPDLDQRLAAVDGQLQAVAAVGSPPDLRQLLMQRRDALLQIEALQGDLANLRAEASREAAGPEPAGAADLGALEAVNTSLESLAASVTVSEQALPATETALQLATRTRKEADATGAGEGALRLAEELEVLAGLQLKVKRARVEASRRQLGGLQRLRDGIESRFAGRPAELKAEMRELAGREASWSRRLAAARVRVEAARAALAATPEPEADGPPGSRAVERRRARELAVQAGIAEQEVASGEVQRIERLRGVWRRRWSVLVRAASRVEMRSWLPESDRWQEERETEAQLAEARVAQLDAEQAALASRVFEGPAEPWARRQRESQERIAAVSREQLEGARQELVTVSRFRGELKRAVGTATVGERAAAVAESVRRVWGFVIARVEDRTITLGSLMMALTYIVVGGWLAGRLTHLLARLLLPRVGVTEGAAVALATLVRYALLALVAVFALWSAGIPLTIFTLLGGALAIGVGLGSQNILNNFISGLVLLVELPIKAGDLVDIEGTVGRVEAVGARSTRIRTFDNTHIIVPNSQLLEKNVVNWTLSDHLVRVVFRVGVAYRSPVRRVEELLQQAMHEHPKVLKKPDPAVFFEEFADSALLFEGQFWITMRSILDRKRVLSDLRFRIDELFRGEGIVVAFPQRDVHLDLAGPVEVKLQPRDGGRGSGEGEEVPGR